MKANIHVFSPFSKNEIKEYQHVLPYDEFKQYKDSHMISLEDQKSG